MNKHNYEHGYTLKQIKRFFAGQWRGRLVGARVRQQLTYVTALFTLAALLFATVGDAWARPLFATAPSLGTAANFAVLAATTVTNAGAGGTIVTGDLGVSPGSAVTGFFPTGTGVVIGTIYAGGAVAAQAQADAATAYAGLTSQACDFNYGAVQEIGGLTLTPGVHCFPSSAQVTGILTLDAQGGDPADVFVFVIGSTLTTASNAQVVVINSNNQPCNVAVNNVFWAVGSSATIGTGTAFAGNILAVTSNTVTTNASVDGRVIALGAAVTLDTNKISRTCITPPPTILIVQKVVINNSGGTLAANAFSFQVNNGTAVTFEADGQNELTVSAGTFNVTEVAVPGYTTTYTNCTNLAIGNGDTAICTITNDDQPANLIVQKVVINNSGGTLAASAFSFQVNGGAAVAFEADGQNNLILNAGAVNVTEVAVPGYTTTYTNCTNLVIGIGGTATCTITNDDQPANLIVQKVVINNSGGSKVVTDFSFQVNGGAAVVFEADGQNNLILNAGTFNVTEVAVAGYATTYTNCTNLAIGIGGTATCTITNTDQPANLIVQKVVINNSGGTLAANNFSFVVNTNAAVAFEADGQNDLTVNAGTYNVTEVAVAGYATTYTSCTNLVIGNSGAATCTITNDDQPAHLKLVKVVNNNILGTATPANFTLTAAGPTPLSGNGSAESDVKAGVYTLSEDGPAGYSASVWSCTSGSLNGNQLTLTLAQSAVCTITNTALPPTILISSNENGKVPGVTYRDEDIIAYDSISGKWLMYFDGSNVGMGGDDIDDFALLPDGDILITTEQDFNLSGFGPVGDEDVLRFHPTSLGLNNTRGTYSMYMDGSANGLGPNDNEAEDVKVVALNNEGRLVISLRGKFNAMGTVGDKLDLITWGPPGTPVGSPWTFRFDGSDVKLTKDLRSAWLRPGTNDIYISTDGNWSVTGTNGKFSGDGNDIFICHQTGNINSATTTCVIEKFLDMGGKGMGKNWIDGLFIHQLPAVLMTGVQASGMIEDDTVEFPGDDADEAPLPNNETSDEETEQTERIFLPVVEN